MGEPQETKQKTSRWRGRAGWILFALGAAERIIGWGGSIDFIISRWSDPGWVGSVLTFVGSYSAYLSFVMMLAGVALLIWNERRRYEAAIERRLSVPVENAAVATPTARPAPAFTDTERDASKLALQELSDFISREIIPLNDDANWINRAPQHLPPQTEELPKLRDRGRALQLPLRRLAERNAYYFGLLEIDLPELERAIDSLSGNFQVLYNKMQVFGGSTEQRFHPMILEFREPAARARGELETITSGLMAEIAQKRAELS